MRGPFYRADAPRLSLGASISLDGAGEPLEVRARVRDLDGYPIAGATVETWQANAQGRYDNDDPANPPQADVFVNRARLLTDENGYYEYETIHPAPYRIGEAEWRPSHIHYLVRHQGYTTLITQLYFKGDPHNRTDRFIKPSLIIELGNKKAAGTTYEIGTFDIVLAPAK